MDIREKLKRVNDELQQIYVRGIDTVHMSQALLTLTDVLNELDKQEETDND